MKPQLQRILAVLGLILICASIVLWLAGLFSGAAKALLLNISLYCFLGAAAILLFIRFRRSQDGNNGDEPKKNPRPGGIERL